MSQRIKTAFFLYIGIIQNKSNLMTTWVRLIDFKLWCIFVVLKFFRKKIFSPSNHKCLFHNWFFCSRLIKCNLAQILLVEERPLRSPASYVYPVKTAIYFLSISPPNFSKEIINCSIIPPPEGGGRGGIDAQAPLLRKLDSSPMSEIFTTSRENLPKRFYFSCVQRDISQKSIARILKIVFQNLHWPP